MIPQINPPWKWGVFTGKGVAEPSKPRTHEGGEVNPDWTCEERGNGVVLSSFPKGNPNEKQTADEEDDDWKWKTLLKNRAGN